MKAALLVLVSGPAASGRATLATRIAAELGVPLLTRDSVRSGLAETQSGWTVTPTAELLARATDAWRGAVTGLLAAGVTVVAEHPLRAEVASADLAPFQDAARIKVVRCRLDPKQRPAPPPPEPRLRPMRTGGMIVERRDPGPARPERDPSITLGVPVLTVEPTARGYRPPLADILWFVRQS